MLGMKKLSEKLAIGFRGYHVFWCPGCKELHSFAVDKDHINSDGSVHRWTWDGNVEAPTFSPSLVMCSNDPDYVCHLYLRNGEIEYLGDCHHELKGQRVPLPDLPAGITKGGE